MFKKSPDGLFVALFGDGALEPQEQNYLHRKFTLAYLKKITLLPNKKTNNEQ